MTDAATATTNEVEQLFMQDDYDSAKLIISRALTAAERAGEARGRERFMAWSLEAFKLIDADKEMKAMKLLKAMAGELPGYRADIDKATRARAEESGQ